MQQTTFTGCGLCILTCYTKRLLLKPCECQYQNSETTVPHRQLSKKMLSNVQFAAECFDVGNSKYSGDSFSTQLGLLAGYRHQHNSHLDSLQGPGSGVWTRGETLRRGHGDDGRRGVKESPVAQSLSRLRGQSQRLSRSEQQRASPGRSEPRSRRGEQAAAAVQRPSPSASGRPVLASPLLCSSPSPVLPVSPRPRRRDPTETPSALPTRTAPPADAALTRRRQDGSGLRMEMDSCLAPAGCSV